MLYMIKFFIKNGFASRRTLWMGILSLIPPACTLLLWILKPHIADGAASFTLHTLFPQINYHLYLHFLLPLIAIFTGTAVLRDEVEERTLSYLITRPVPRWMIVLSKMTAGIITAGTMLFISLFLTWVIMLLDISGGEWTRNLGQVFQSAGIILLGMLVYIPLFTLLGGLIKRPVLVGLFFTFGWEGTVAVFPGNVKLLTIAHYLHVLSPPLQKIDTGIRSKLFSFIMPTQNTSDLTAILVLIGCMAVFAGLAAMLLHVKEFRLQQE